MSKTYEVTTVNKESPSELPILCPKNKHTKTAERDSKTNINNKTDKENVISNNLFNGNNFKFIDADIDTNDDGDDDVDSALSSSNQNIITTKENNAKLLATVDYSIRHADAKGQNIISDDVAASNIELALKPNSRKSTDCRNGKANLQCMDQNADKMLEKVVDLNVVKNKKQCFFSDDKIVYKCNDKGVNKCDVNIKENGAKYKTTMVSEKSEDPYAELEFYLENVKREINEVFEQFKLSEGLHRSVPDINNKLLPEKANLSISKSNKVHAIGSEKQQNVQDEEAIKTAEWANTILKELDNLMQSDKRNAAKSDDHDGHLEKNAAKCNILKPEKHTYIPLHSFNLDKAQLDISTQQHRKFPRKISRSISKHQNFPVLKIEEDSEIDQKNEVIECKTISTQTNAITDNKKGSTSTIWTSEESILRSVGAVDDDNKSTSSSACEEASGVLSSGKSGNSLDSSELENDNTESGIGTATPPKEQDSWRNHLLAQKRPLDQYIISNFDKHTWVRRENVTTQTSPAIVHSTPYFKSNSNEDPDLLEILSLCGGANDDYDFIEEESIEQKNGINNDSSFGTYSTYSTKSSADQEEDNEVVLRHIVITSNYSPHPSTDMTKSSMFFPANFSDNSFTDSNTKSDGGHSPLPRRDVFGSLDRKYESGQQTRRPFCLQINHEPYQNILELPSPSSASLHSGQGNISIQELTTKSNSAPILLKKERRRDDFAGQTMNLRYSRSQSDRYLAEIEAVEACKWLRAAGFPQYAQMYEDMQFPIDLTNVAKDHPFLENDPLQSLYRRLVALNRCATMRLDSAHKHGNQQKDDSEEEEYALSENWTFEKKNRRWSRVDEIGIDLQNSIFDKSAKNVNSRDSSPERVDTNVDSLGFSTLPIGMSCSQNEHDQLPVRFRRTGSERLKDGAKAFLRRVESIKSRRRKRQNREGVIISEPQVLDLTQINQKMTDMKCIDVVTMSTPPSPIPTSPFVINPKNIIANNNNLKVCPEYSNFSQTRLSPNYFSQKTHQTSQSNRTSPLHFFSNNPNIVIDFKSGDESSSYYSDASQESCGGGLSIKHPSRTKRFFQKGSKVEDIGAMSDSECHQSVIIENQKYFNNTNSNNTELKPPKLLRGGSLNLGKESQRYRDAFKSRSFRSRSSSRRKDDESKHKNNLVVRWHSFQSHDRPDYLFKKCFSNRYQTVDGMPLAAMSCGQIQVVRKLALVTLTGYMERYCPTHRSGWNWELPKFIKKIKAPDYKDKKVFGVPILLLLQRTGETLPKSIQTALKWLKLNAMDQIGIFRKSGVKSRIMKLKTYVEESPVDTMSVYDIQQAYDVADMVKQYFRELPDMLLTAKMSETFVAIFQHLPPEVRPDAVQSAVLLLPDEHREVLQHLLEFLYSVADNSMYNQMTANNLAVCLAPSLFHGGIASMRTNVASPRRRKATGVPDPRELSETRASHECLTYLIENCRAVFTISSEKIIRCNFGYMEESRPVPLEALGEGLQVHDWRGYLYECTSATIKEGREKSRGWISSSSFDSNVDIAYKKVGDGHPLRLWRCTTEIDAPPTEVLQYVFKERHHWDQHLLKWRIIEQLDDKSEIFQYASGGQTITDFCVLRSWRSDLPRGACVIVETSVDHMEATLLLGGVRGVVLASRYLIEPCGSGRSRIMHLARVDIKGKTPEWYNKTYGHICSHHLGRIRNAFKHVADGPESKV